MVNPLSINGKPVNNLYEYVCDTEDDIYNLPKGCAPGSTAFIIETAEVYMINSNREWVKIS